MIYVFNPEGNLVHEFEQFHESRYGMRDLTWDGNLIWGADEDVLYGFNVRGDLVETIEGDAGSYRSLTWDPENGVFWSADITSDLFATDLNGDVVRTIRRPGDVRFYGLAYWTEDPDGYNLYAFSRGDETDLMVSKMNLDNGEAMTVAEFDFNEQRPGGITITNRLDYNSWLFLGIVQSPDILAVWQLASRTDWLTVEPVEGVIEADGEGDLTVTLSSDGMPPEVDLTAELHFTHDGFNGSFELPVQLSVTGEGGFAVRRLDLRIGWNMVSVNVVPQIEDVPELLASLVEDGSLILVKDGSGHFFLPALDFNNIDHWVGVEGYQVKMARGNELEIEGEAVAWDTRIDLSDGWNLVSYLPRSDVDAVEALSNLGEALEIAKDGRGNFYIPAWNYSNMGQMCEGFGYYLKVNGDVGLVYSLGGGRLIVFDSPYDASDRVWLNELTYGGTSFSLLLLTDDLEAGTRLEAYTPSGILAGRGIVDANGMCGMALWGDDPSDNGEGRHSCRPDNSIGFSEGEEVTIRIYVEQGSMNRPLRVLGGSLRVIAGSPSSSSLAWTADGWAVARLGTTSIPVEFGIHRAYPNPFNSLTNIRYQLPKQSEVSIRIFDIQGREVVTLVNDKIEAGYYNVVWNAVEFPSGLYICRMDAANYVKSVKISLMK